MSRVAGLCAVWLVSCAEGAARVDPTGPSASQAPATDTDGDGVPDADDNCVGATNADQADADGDAVGDACDDLTDVDGDAVDDGADNCRGLANPDQLDGDSDLRGDGCDNCPSVANADQADVNADLIGDACPCDACGTDWCTLHPDTPSVATCSAVCLDERRAADGICCAIGSRSGPDGACLLPDIWLDEPRLLGSLQIAQESFTEADCEWVEQCINGTGDRKLLKFDTRTPSTGAGDLFLGRPEDLEPGVFVYSECHAHHHFESYAFYELLDVAGNLVAPGRKQAFCLLDWERHVAGAEGPQYHCGYQGISKDWADIYSAGLDCQFIDVTDVPGGDYTLRVTLNSEHVLAELDYSNNASEIPVTLP